MGNGRGIKKENEVALEKQSNTRLHFYNYTNMQKSEDKQGSS